MNKEINQAIQAQKRMKADTQDLELKARYWKAQWEIRYYTLEAEKLQPDYDEYIKIQQEKNELAYKEYMERMEQLKNSPEVEVEETENA